MSISPKDEPKRKGLGYFFKSSIIIEIKNINDEALTLKKLNEKHSFECINMNCKSMSSWSK